MSEVSQLEQEIIKHKQLYYSGAAQITDEDYDLLERRLRQIAPESPVLNMVGSPNLSDQKIAHAQKMLSLNKTYKQEDLIDWIGDKDVISTQKIDGSSCSLVYTDGALVMAKTRGDGSFGENILPKVLFITDIPKKLNTYQNEIEVRGEVYCTEENFVLLSQEMKKRKLEEPKSLRNIVAGLLGRKDSINLSKFLSFQAFELIEKKETLQSELEKFKLLKNLGFITPKVTLHESAGKVLEVLEDAQTFMAQGNYLIDGVVFSYNELALHRELGATAHHPRYKLAFKFQGVAKESKIIDIEWRVSRSGFLNPVALIEPVELSGAVVSRVTLHNYGIVHVHQLKAGDTIKLLRSGEVIPKFLEKVKSAPGEFTVPSICPSCKGEVDIVDIRIICSNLQCPAQLHDKILNFIQKIGIDDLSGKRLDELINAKLVSSIPDLYRLRKEQLLELDKVQEKMATKIVKNIDKTKNITLVKLLASLGIPGGALSKCEKIVDNGYDSIEKIKNLTLEQLMSIESFAQKSSEDFLEGIANAKSTIDDLIKLGVTVKKSQKIASLITGKKICITGSLEMKRSELQKLIKLNSGIVSSSVTKETDFLVTNDEESNSSKFKKARELQIQILKEKELLEMINGKA